LSEGAHGVLELFQDGEEVVAFRTPEELRMHAKRLLENPRQLKEVALAGWERVSNDTYVQRAHEILASI
jgi:spore maturation protein CgeB